LWGGILSNVASVEFDMGGSGGVLIMGLAAVQGGLLKI
jgi:hypothetical protein